MLEISAESRIENQDFEIHFGERNPKFAIIDNLFDEKLIADCQDEFFGIDTKEFVRYSNPLFEFEKYALNDVQKMPKNLAKIFIYLHSAQFIAIVEKITGIQNLSVDQKRWGGGLHMTKKGGYLAVHKDFNILPTSYREDDQMVRCINVIGYLNKGWKKGDGGMLEFWDDSGKEKVSEISPLFNRWVVFDTRDCYHGHPHPYHGESARISIASYYYIKEKVEEQKWMSTEYLKLPWMKDSEEYQKARLERANHKLRYSGLL